MSSARNVPFEARIAELTAKVQRLTEEYGPLPTQPRATGIPYRYVPPNHARMIPFAVMNPSDGLDEFLVSQGATRASRIGQVQHYMVPIRWVHRSRTVSPEDETRLGGRVLLVTDRGYVLSTLEADGRPVTIPIPFQDRDRDKSAD